MRQSRTTLTNFRSHATWHIRESCAYEFSPARGTRVKNNKTCTRDYEAFVHVELSTALATFRASGGSHGVTECILTWIYCRNRKHTACHRRNFSQSRKRIYVPGLNDRVYIPLTFALLKSIDCCLIILHPH